jgi:ubiquinone/menaquinone biosynthesis C-methylase UbiE
VEYSITLVLRVNELFHDVEGKAYEDIHPEIFKNEIVRWQNICHYIFPQNRVGNIRFLDIGSGTGFVPITVAHKLKSDDLFICTDISKEKLKICRENIENEEFACQFKYLKLTGTGIPIESNSVNLISMNSVLHHIPNFNELFAEINRLLKVGGKIIVGHEPNKLSKNNIIISIYKTVTLILFKPRELIVSFLRKMHLINTVRSIVRPFNKKTKNNHDILAEVNAQLLSEGLIPKPLSLDQLTEIVDIQSPGAGGSFHRERGIDINVIVKDYLPSFEVEYFESYNHLGTLIGKNVFVLWCEKYLNYKYPKEGETFCAILKKIK